MSIEIYRCGGIIYKEGKQKGFVFILGEGMV